MSDPLPHLVGTTGITGPTYPLSRVHLRSYKCPPGGVGSVSTLAKSLICFHPLTTGSVLFLQGLWKWRPTYEALFIMEVKAGASCVLGIPPENPRGGENSLDVTFISTNQHRDYVCLVGFEGYLPPYVCCCTVWIKYCTYCINSRIYKKTFLNQ